ncbi:unnamed protein product [Didymodactylos carnosus]|uniref:Vacuolar membrane protease n=1 Tax=Didymodactylos carnosus TaxID=1234261 RepID=A0A814K2D7_9BILA|nr:unnamed protein product [Didymodactylos carnosus]CAF3816594.1 unnamed protein product [Didymodactylos carnosus]
MVDLKRVKWCLRPSPSTLFDSICLWFILPVLLVVITASIALTVSFKLPKVKSQITAKSEFSEERARLHYVNLTANGPRVANTKSDYLARDYILEQLNIIDKRRTNKQIRFEIDVQEFRIMFGMLKNFIVRLSDIDLPIPVINETSSLLLSAHYDSVEFSPGASDDGSGIVILLEILSNLVNDESLVLKTPIIFNFNNGEEIDLLGATAFIYKHQWAHNVKRFINLESTGGPEKAILFRIKPSQLIKHYSNVPYPHANVIGDEVIKALPVDTDYTIYNQQIAGFDFAFYLDGYTYHTSLDSASLIEQGALQHLGENTLSLIRHLLTHDDGTDAFDEDENYIFFDFIGKILVKYSFKTSVIIQSILISYVFVFIITIITIDHIMFTKYRCNDKKSVYYYYSTVRKSLCLRILFILFSFASYIASLLVGIGYTLLISLIVSKIRPFFWYGKSSLAVALYFLTSLLGMIFVQYECYLLVRLLSKRYGPKNNWKQFSYHAFDVERQFSLLFVWCLFMIVSMITKIRSFYIVLVWSIFICFIYTAVIFIEKVLLWYSTVKYHGHTIQITREVDRQSKNSWKSMFTVQRRHWLLVPFIASFIPLIHSIELISRLLRLAIPMMSRTSETPIPRDLIVSAIIALIICICTLTFLPMMNRAANYLKTIIFIFIAFIIIFIISCTTYSFTTMNPKLIKVKHSSRSMHIYNPKDLLISSSTPVTVPKFNQTMRVRVVNNDQVPFSGILQKFTSKSGQELKNLNCTSNRCDFDDFNRMPSIISLQIISLSDTLYTIQFNHVSTYQASVKLIGISNFSLNILDKSPFIRDSDSIYKYGIATNQTIVDVKLYQYDSKASITFTLQTCDMNDSPFLSLLQQTIPYVKAFGNGECQLITDAAILTFTDS